MVVSERERNNIRQEICQILPDICRKQLTRQKDFSIEALIGIRFSKDDVLLITLNQNWKNDKCEETNFPTFINLSFQQDLCPNVSTDNSFTPQKQICEANDEHSIIKCEEIPDMIENSESITSIIEDKGEITTSSQKISSEMEPSQEIATSTDDNEKMSTVIEASEEMVPSIEAREEMVPLIEENEKISAVIEAREEMVPLIEDNEKISAVIEAREEMASVINVKEEDEAQILIPNQDSNQVMMPQKIWELLQQGKCKVRATPEGQIITAPITLLLPHFSNLLSPKTQPKKRGRPLKQPDSDIAQKLVADSSGLIRHIEDGSVAVFTEDNLPDTVLIEEVKTVTSDEYRCDICGKCLASARSLEYHKKGLHAPPSHQCRDCGEHFPYPLKQQRCRGCLLPGKKPRAMRCLSCGRMFKHRFLLMRHRATCAQSDKLDKDTLEKYMTIIEETTLEENQQQPSHHIECNHCKETFPTEKLVKSHIREKHPGSVQCSGCGERFDNLTLLKHHKKFCQSVIHLGEAKKPKQFICQYCARVYNSNSRLNDHIKGIHLEPSIYCSCGAAFRWRSSLNKHKEKCPYARPDDGKTPRKAARIKIAGEEYVCTYCGISYRSDSGLRSHIQVKHKQTAAFRCTICNAFFATRGALIKHRTKCPPKKTATKSRKLLYKCTACQLTFKKQVFLEKHIIGKHLPGRRYKCNLCGKKFRWNGGLGRHRAKCKKNHLVKEECVDDIPGLRGVVNHPDVMTEPIEDEAEEIILLECSLEEALVANINDGQTEITPEQVQQLLRQKIHQSDN